MNLNHTMNEENKCITIALEGKVDSMNAAETEAAIMDLRQQYNNADIIIDAEKLEYIVMPFGAESIKYDRAMKNVTIPKQAKKVKIDCMRLKELEIPDGVESLELYNVSEKLEQTLEIPDSVKYLKINDCEIPVK